MVNPGHASKSPGYGGSTITASTTVEEHGFQPYRIALYQGTI